MKKNDQQNQNIKTEKPASTKTGSFVPYNQANQATSQLVEIFFEFKFESEVTLHDASPRPVETVVLVAPSNLPVASSNVAICLERKTIIEEVEAQRFL